MLNIGFGEMIAIGIIALVVIGPEKFPDFAKMCFRTFRELRGHFDDLKSEVGKEINPLRGKFNELRRIDPEKYIDQLVEGDIEEDEEHQVKDPELERVTPEYGMESESEDYWSNADYGTEPVGGVEAAVEGEADARDEAELPRGNAEKAADEVGTDDAPVREAEDNPAALYESLSVPYHEGTPDTPDGKLEGETDTPEEEHGEGVRRDDSGS